MIDRLRVTHRLAAVGGVPLLLLILAALVAGLQLGRIEDANARIEADRIQLDTVAQWVVHVRNNLDRAVLTTRLDAAIGDDDALRTRLAPPLNWLAEGMAQVAQASGEAQQRIDAAAQDAEVRTLVAQAIEARQQFVATRARIRDDLLMGAGTDVIDGELASKAAALVQLLDRLQAHIQARTSQASQSLAAAVGHAQLVLVLACVAALAAGSLLAYAVGRTLVSRLAAVKRFAEAVAAGQLTAQAEARGGDEVAELQRAMLHMRDALAGLVGQVKASADHIRVASREVASGNADLSGRTEQAAASLQQTASSIEQVAGTVRHSADAAAQASQLAGTASGVAARGGQVVSQVVATMHEIDASSRRIADIIGVIDGIAFQTNILALNAAVEAARAGDQGKGFAVVAGEVRSLAQRSADAAREIKSLIGSSVERVAAGSRLVADAGSTMQEIVSSVSRVTDIVGEIAAATAEQSTGIGQVSTAVGELDRMTQQNAALVEQSAAAAASLRQQSEQLAALVQTFETDDAPAPA